MLSPVWEDYELVDSGGFEKLERFGTFVTARPEPQAVWRKTLSESEWQQQADAWFRRDARNEERGQWNCRREPPQPWTVAYDCCGSRLTMRLGLTSFKHVGLFPEQAANWDFIHGRVAGFVAAHRRAPQVLNLFAYTGGATLAACSAGAAVTHVDSVRQVVDWARGNMELSGLEGVRWIVDDALKFVRREVRRGKRYEGIILDPPAYGRGPDGEKWVLEQHLAELLEECAKLLVPQSGFLVFNLYSMGLSPLVARSAVHRFFGVPPREEFGELYFTDRGDMSLPLGVFYRLER